MAKSDGRGSGGATKKKNSKKNSKKAGVNRVTMKSQAAPPKDNPFETIWSRRKFDILGKKRKGEERRVGLARSRAIDKRKLTLLKEFEQSGKASQFVDRRIGEQNDALSDFDKIVMRSQRERKVKSLKKGGKYNLSDGEEDDLGIEDIEDGGFFSGRDDFGEEMEPNDDDDMAEEAREKRRAMRESLANDLTGEDENRPKTKKEIMLEVIQKSKHFKDLRKMEKEENVQLIEDLDKNFKSLVQSEALVSLTHPGKINALRALVHPGDPEEQIKKNRESFSAKSAFPEQERPDAYDRLFNEMKMEARAKGSDRKKTAEEIAEEEKERLEELEKERQKRMDASSDNSSDGDDDDDDDGMGDADKLSSRKARPISGDDLGDSFTPDEKQGKRSGWVDEILAGKDADDSDDAESDEDAEEEADEESEEESDEENEGGDDKVETLKDWEQSDDELVTGCDNDEDLNQEEHDQHERGLEMVTDVKSRKKKEAVLDSMKRKGDAKHSLTQQRELPYVIEAPSSMADLCSLLENRSNKEIVEAIKRIRVTNAIALAAENRKKTQVFYGLLLQYFATLANKHPLNFELLNLLVRPLMEMSVEIPYFSAICARERILRTREQLYEDCKDPEKNCWPSLKTLLLLRLWSMTYPCSDFRHTVMTPAILLMCEYLMRCRILSGRDVAIGSFLCSMLLSVCKQSQKFCPEALMYLKTMLMAYSNNDTGSNQEFKALPHLLELEKSKSLLCIKDRVDAINPLDFFNIMNMPEDSPYISSDDFRASVLVSVVETITGFVGISKNLNAFPEIYMPISKSSAELAKQENMRGPLLDKLTRLAKLIKTETDSHIAVRLPIQMTQKKQSIKLISPKVEENFVKGRDYDPDRERVEARKMKKLLKEERKGAIRELKKDNAFLHDLKEKEMADREVERAEKYGKALAFLQEQEHAAKSGQLGKGRKRRK